MNEAMTPNDKPQAQIWYMAARNTALVAGVFCLVMLILLVITYLHSKTYYPFNSAKIVSFQVQLAQHPADEHLKNQIRQYDLRLRKEYFRAQAQATRGAYLLFGGLVVFLGAASLAWSYRKQLPIPRPEAVSDDWVLLLMNRRSVIVMGLLLGGILISIAALSRHDSLAEYARSGALLHSGGPVDSRTSAPANGTSSASPVNSAAPNTIGVVISPANGIGQTVKTTLPSETIPALPKSAIPAFPDGWQDNWPQFRGPDGVGVAQAGNYPTQWDGKSGQGIRWKVAVPLPGENSPIVWKDRVFLSGATEKERTVFCYSTENGKLLWKTPVTIPGSAGDLGNIMEDTGFAAPTMATDGRQVYAMFANGNVVCLTLEGKQVWARDIGKPENTYGHASSLVMLPNCLLIQFDQGSAAEDGKSALLALEPATGKIRWQVLKRPVPNSWSTPLFIHDGQQTQIITSGNPWVISYDASNGAELWRANCLASDVASSPIYANGMVYAGNYGSNMAAIRIDGRGDVTKTHVAWLFSDGLPDIVSPLYANGLLLMAASDGTVTCLDAASGKKVWDHFFSQPFQASPVLLGNVIYFTDISGVTHLLEAGRQFRELGSAALGEEVHASLAFVQGYIYIRGKQSLFCIGAKN